ncbi:MAG: coproporphyrinogen dehydrogenase HemZ [Oscillospiraceae bacterium]|nr:coproporphyrinogen dehydrogenase HemZ [Oscillospiraceae bacterium]
MKLYLKGHNELYAVEQLQLQLFPDEPTDTVTEPFSGEEGAVSALSQGKTWITATAKVTWHGRTARAIRRIPLSQGGDVRLRRRILQQAYFLAATEVLGITPPWGALSGVRPTKLSTWHMQEGGTERSADRMLRDVYFVTPERRRLAIDCSRHTIEAASLLEKKDLSLYIGIPFCPTRCAYCSFVSQSVEKFGKFLEPYLDALIREIAYTGKLLRQSGYRIRSLYMGGGTPTTLSARQMERLLAAVNEHFDLSGCLEFTVEGGRPDTLDLEKLQVIHAGGADRMSINPQTMSDEVLRRIGRSHDVKQIYEAYEAAQKAGFKVINMDLIAGLPGDTEAGFLSSVRKVIELEPGNITVHTLALKKAAALYSQRHDLPAGEAVARMLDETERLLREAGYEPYYLYRQKYMSGSFENVGWCKPGTMSVYNIYMMEELHTILSLGGGGMNKVNTGHNQLERYHNPKIPQDYIARIDTILEQKDAIFEILDTL